MTHTITITLNKEAQKKALLEGAPAQAMQVYEIPDNNPDLLRRVLRLPWTEVSSAGEVSCVVGDISFDKTGRVAQNGLGWGVVNGRLESRPDNTEAAVSAAESVCAVAAEKAAEALRKEQDRERQESAERAKNTEIALAWARLPIAARVNTNGEIQRPDVHWSFQPQDLPEYARAMSEAEHESTRINEVRVAAKREQEQRENLSALVREDQRERYEAGVLPEDELEQALLDRYLPQLPYALTWVDNEQLANQECSDEEGHARLIVTKTKPITTLTIDEWTHLKRIRDRYRDALPEGVSVEIEPVINRVECEHHRCRAFLEVRRIRCTRHLPSGRELTRRYDLHDGRE